MHCASCAITTEKVLRKTAGVVSAYVNFATERAIEYEETRVDQAKVAQVIKDNGYEPVFSDEGRMQGMHHGPHEMPVESHLAHGGYVDLKGLIAAAVLAVPLAALGILNPLLAGLAMAFSSVSVLTNSLRIARRMG